MKEAYLYKKLQDNGTQCQTCAHYCQIAKGKIGICGVRKNENGKIYSLVYGRACAVNIDPIEKKPFFHFLPGTKSLSFAAPGCNFSCQNCQNWTISQAPKIFNEINGENILPEAIVDLAVKNKLPSISYTYTEPAIFLEYALNTMKLAKEKHIKNCWVTNGFLSKETLELIAPYLDAANVDLKGFSEEFYKKYCGGRLQPVLNTLKEMKTLRRGSGQEGIWVEITTLIIPGLNDDQKTLKAMADFIKNELGPETPWHVTEFCGAISWKLQAIPDTPIESMEKARQIGLEAGLKYVYCGNIPGIEGENTFCPKCKTKAIDRLGYSVSRHDKNGRCPKCNEDLNLTLD